MNSRMKLFRVLSILMVLALAIPGALAEATLAEATLAEAPSGEILHLTFDEGSGDTVHDASGNLPDAEIDYRFLHAAFTDDMEPQWRDAGVEGGALLFDGSSTAIAYSKDATRLEGSALTISAWVAPRAFEWDDPEAAERGDAHLTAIAGQYSSDKNRGALLGYQRFGRLCFQVGVGEEHYTLWADDARLERYAWNHVAAVFDGEAGRMAIYQNGELAGEIKIPAGSTIAPAENDSLVIGRNDHAEAIAAGTYNMFAGMMDELRIEARPLGADEIAALADVDAPEIPYEDIALENILTGDIYKTQYHGGPYQHWMNEPHAPLYYNGMYHLFFQSNSVGTYWRNICWGHLVSEDTVHWRPVKEAIVPTEGSVVPDGVWSGGATLDVNGVPVLFFTAGNDSFAKEGLISNQNIGAAYPADLSDPELTDWVICDELAIAQQSGQGRPGEFRDPHIWREGESWYMLICSGSAETTGGSALLYVTDKLEVKQDGTIDMDWQYKGPIYEMEDQSVIYGTSWELPILLPLQNRDGTIERYAFFISPAPAGTADNKVYYFVGDFDKESGKFTPDEAFGGLPRMLDYGSNVFTGPSVLVDPATGRVCMFSIMQDQRSGAEEGAAGWAHCVGLTRNLYLSEDGSDVCVCPDPRLYDLLGEPLLTLEDVSMDEANEALSGVSGDLLYISATLVPQGDAPFGITVKANDKRDETTFTYDVAAATISGSTRNRGKGAASMVVNGALPLDDGSLKLEIFIDRSLVEAFFNGDKAVSVRSYAKADSQKITLFAEGGLQVASLAVYPVSSIYE